jgi:hypothetical protein
MQLDLTSGINLPSFIVPSCHVSFVDWYLFDMYKLQNIHYFFQLEYEKFYDLFFPLGFNNTQVFPYISFK